MSSLLMEALLEDGLGGGLGDLDALLEIINTAVTSMMWLIVLISIPALLLAVANCFFGVRIFRVLLVINTAITGGVCGMLICGITTAMKLKNPKAAMIIGFILFAAVFGVLAWFAYKVFLFLQCFNIGFGLVWGIGLPIIFGSLVSQIVGLAIGSASVMSESAIYMSIMSMLSSLTGKLVFLLVFSLIVAVTLGILSVIYTKLIVMCTTAYKGGAKIASILALLAITKPAYLVIYFILLIGFVAGGFCTQYFMDKKNPCNIDRNKTSNQPQQYYQPQQYAPQQYAPQPQQYVQQQAYAQPQVYAQPQQFVQPVNSIPKVVLKGLEGQYKGFDFDIDKDTFFGRDVEKCNIVFPENIAGVSRIQCHLSLNPQTGAVSIEDKYSTYGTSVNGVKLGHDEIKYLNTGDVITFGENIAFKIEYTS